MPRETITSRRNAVVQKARAVREGRERELIFVEGVRLCEEAASAGLLIETVLCVEGTAHEERGARLLSALEARRGRVHFASPDVLEYVSDTKTPQGVVALARRPPTGRDVLEKTRETPLVVLMHGVNNPSNAGAMLRVSEAAGATGVITTRGSTALFSAKSLRGAMGSAFRLPLWTGADFTEALEWCAQRRIRSVSTHLSAERSHMQLDWTIPRAVIVGSEGAGLSPAEAQAADDRIRIPMRETVESLNVAVALGIVLYEAVRQRQNPS